MPAKYFPSLSPNGIDYNTMPNLGDMAQAPRGQDPMHYGFQGSKGPQSPYAPIVGQAADALMDPRMGMFPGAGLAGAGFRATGRMGRKGLNIIDDVTKEATASHKQYGGPKPWEQVEVTAPGAKKFGLDAAALEREPLPFQQATTMRQPQGDQSMGKAIQGLAESMGWSSEKMADWLVQNGFRSGR